ncbi:maleylpyruvate isomerase N-terminal domain-containing protein [Chitinophaga sp. MM2321]|uniref:maleylpyruvate isomerase N-terminal domain-containing protein n=1 Tax=Chitinophaga sp. MM2321 TaxID=3137178 RepID=UPI0032D5A72B
MALKTNIPIDVVHLIPMLDRKLLDLLKSLKPNEWQKQTVAKLWTVKDVVAHLVDGNIRMLSILRDNYFGEQITANSYQDLVNFLNGLNADWVKAMKRVSPQMLIFLLEITNQPYYDYLKSLDPFDKSVLAVSWAGEAESKNWMEIARQYTEKWLHQQQIRDAVNMPGLMMPELYYPFIDIFMLALPYTYRSMTADNGTIVKVTITTEIGGSWYLLRTDNTWNLEKNLTAAPTAEIIIDPDTSWKLFSKSLRPEQVKDKVKIHGEEKLGATALTMLSVMA